MNGTHAFHRTKLNLIRSKAHPAADKGIGLQAYEAFASDGDKIETEKAAKPFFSS